MSTFSFSIHNKRSFTFDCALLLSHDVLAKDAAIFHSLSTNLTGVWSATSSRDFALSCFAVFNQ